MVPQQNPRAKVGDLLLEYHLADFTNAWQPVEPETVFFHHGFCRHMDLWRGWVPQLSRDYRVLRINARGCGESTAPPPGTPYKVGDLVDDAIGLLDALGIDKVHWVAESSGGIIGLTAALAYPDRFRSLTLCNTPFKEPDVVKNDYAAGEADQVTAIEKHGVGYWSRQTLKYRLDLSKASQEMQDWYVQRMDTVPRHVAAAYVRMLFQDDMWAKLPSIRMPTLIMAGEHSKIARKEQMEQMQRQMPNAKLVIFKDIGNGISSLIPERCAAEFRAFLSASRP